MVSPSSLFSVVILFLLVSHAPCQENEEPIDYEAFFGSPPASTPQPQPHLEEKDTSTSDCECIPYYLCANGTIITDGDGIIDIRMNENSECTNYLDVCCGKDQIRDEPITPPSVKVAGCGQRNSDGVGMRISGNVDEALFGEFPWTVAILREELVEGSENKLNVYQCGGALIDRRVVLTGAHCIQPSKQYKIRAGEWDTQTKNEIFPHQDRFVSKVVLHPHFNPGSLANDVALLILAEPVTLAENIDIACLPPMDHSSENERCFTSGWGKDKFAKEGRYQVIMKKLELPVVGHDVCQRQLRNTRLGRHFILDRSFICAGGEEGRDACTGDGGSPLVCPIPGCHNKYYQAGIVAWGIGCGEDGVPGVYVNVAKFRNWIDDQMSANRLSIEYSYS